MNAKQLKLIGIITMTIDHIAVFLMEPSGFWYVFFRSVGRIAFPIFALMVVEGFIHTRNVYHYFIRLFSFAILIESVLLFLYLRFGVNMTVFHWLGEGGSENIIWPLVLGLGAIILLSHPKPWIKTLALLPILLAIVLRTSYGFYGVLMIVLLYGYRHDVQRLLYGGMLTALYVYLPMLADGEGYFPSIMLIQFFALIAFILFFFYNGKKGKQNKWFFYMYYPAHIILLFVIAMVIGGEIM